MEKSIYIMVVEDEAEVLNSIVRDIELFENKFPVEMADTAEEAAKIIEDILSEGDQIGLILCDHVLPGKNGVDLLVELQKDEKTQSIKKVLITGQAGLEDTVKAVNKADLKHYIEKPWKKADLVDTCRRLLTDYVIENRINIMPYMDVLDAERLADHLRKNKDLTDR